MHNDVSYSDIKKQPGRRNSHVAAAFLCTAVEALFILWREAAFAEFMLRNDTTEF
jgi:hypothetical protein